MTINLLKVIALIMMFLDHVGEFIPNSPIWMRYIGRISAPIFFYCSAWGFHYTHDRKIYLIRLYIMGVIMSCGNILVSHFLCKDELLSNNIFSTIFMGCVIVFILERAKHDIKKIAKYALIFLFAQIGSFFLCVLFAEFLSFPHPIDTYMLYYFYGALFGNSIFVEGSILFVAYFVCVYLLKSRNLPLTAFHVFYSLLISFLVRRTHTARGALSYLIPFNTYQWLMLLAIPFFLLYNGKRGKSKKAFFYIFYPAHIWILTIIGHLM